MKRRLVASVLLVFALFGGTAHADATATAEELFQHAKTLISQGKWSEACPPLAESYRLDPAGGTLQNLAVCYETTGRWASAVARFEELKTISKTSNPPRLDRIKLADEHLAKIRSKVSHLVFSLPDDAEVEIDGVTYQRASWSLGIAVDPGPHDVVVHAVGKKPFKTSVTTPSEATEQNVTVTLEDLPPAPPAPTLADDRHSKEEQAARDRAESARTARRNGYFIGGAGLALVGGGMLFGALAMGKNDEAERRCSDGATADDFNKDGRCIKGSPTYRDARNEQSDARRLATVSTILTAAGVVGLGVGAYFVFVRGRTTAATLRLGPTLGGAFAEGTF
ncbi:MAG: hypothetical protein KIT84_14235 [Labilithrix sp.]|nr:hypothetical protein [Labilithrix sp.]MCW5812180.1 hypothetical protein [Labilithrix sp.]